MMRLSFCTTLRRILYLGIVLLALPLLGRATQENFVSRYPIPAA